MSDIACEYQAAKDVGVRGVGEDVVQSGRYSGECESMRARAVSPPQVPSRGDKIPCSCLDHYHALSRLQPGLLSWALTPVEWCSTTICEHPPLTGRGETQVRIVNIDGVGIDDCAYRTNLLGPFITNMGIRL